jgi:hypothetical protein
MPGKGISDLPMPPHRFRPDMMAPEPVQHSYMRRPPASFETLEEAIAEDLFRMSQLVAGKGHPDAMRGAALDLARRLDDPEGASTMASRVYMRDHRIRLGGNMAMLCEQFPTARPFTVIPQGWLLTPSELENADPVKRLAGFRADLYRCGAASADGFLIAILHGEYDPGRNLYQLHTHGLVAGGMLAVVDQLRERPKYQDEKRGSGEAQLGIQRIRVTQKEPTNFPLTMAYCLQSFWPSKWTGVTGSGEYKRQRDKRRIPDPLHSQVLLWLDRWDLNDIALLVHVRVTNSGLQVKGTE